MKLALRDVHRRRKIALREKFSLSLDSKLFRHQLKEQIINIPSAHRLWGNEPVKDLWADFFPNVYNTNQEENKLDIKSEVKIYGIRIFSCT